MSKPESVLNKYRRLFLFAAILAAVIYLIVQNISIFGNILLVLLGFGAVVLVHEFGHFIVAKFSDIKVEAFSIGFPPVLAGIKRTASGYRIRILPHKETEGTADDDSLSFTIGRKAKPGETEYRIGLIPFGGFVKMLGQEDTKTIEASNDPRSYANKPVGVRMAVIAAGVIFNVISAMIVFMMVFLIGIKLTPPIVGGVVADSPAARAGLRPGDEIIEIDGKNHNLDFMKIAEAAALSDRAEQVQMKVRHEDGSVGDFAIVAEQLPGSPMKGFGIESPLSLTVAELLAADANALFEKTGLKPADRIKAAGGINVQSHWHLQKIVQNAFVPSIIVSAERNNELIQSHIGLVFSPSTKQVKSESDLSHIYSMLPRLKITDVLKPQLDLQSGDIILAISDIENPTYKELRNITEEYEDKELSVKVLRADANGVEKALMVTVVPRRPRGSDRVMIGIGIALDAEHPVVAKTIAVEGWPRALEIPRGVVITAVDGVKVSNFYEIIKEIKRNVGKRITIDYQVDEKTVGAVTLDVGDSSEFITTQSLFSEFVPFKSLERLYKAGGPVDALVMGYRRTRGFIRQAFLTLQRAVRGLVSPKNFMGPVGIATFSYKIVSERPLIYYVYWLGLVSSFIAVFNFLPLLPFDGGHIVFLLVEKIKGSPVNEQVQTAVLYTGLAMVGAFVLYVTFNDIVRSFFS